MPVKHARPPSPYLDAATAPLAEEYSTSVPGGQGSELPASIAPISPPAVSLTTDTVTKVAYSGIDLKDKDQIVSILSLDFEEADAPSGVVTVNLAGDGALALTVECLDVLIKDVTRPYLAPSGSEPRHAEDKE